MGARITTIARAFGMSLLAAALVAGAAIVASAPAEASVIHWSLQNKTNQPIWLDMFAQIGSNTSTIHYPKEAPMKAGEGAIAEIQDNAFYLLYYWGKYCYLGGMWNLQRDSFSALHSSELWPSKTNPAVLVVKMQDRETALVKTGPCRPAAARDVEVDEFEIECDDIRPRIRQTNKLAAPTPANPFTTDARLWSCRGRQVLVDLIEGDSLDSCDLLDLLWRRR